WDTHGLPVEIEVEKELQLNGKKAIESYGVAEFNARARQSVVRSQSEWEQLSDRIAYWLDYEHPYITCSNAYIESVWWLLERLPPRDPLYRAHPGLLSCRPAGACCTGGTVCCRTAPGAAGCSPATSWRRGTRKSPPTPST